MTSNRYFNTLRYIRLIAVMEGISYILLLGIAMPMKYYAGMPEAVKYTGWAHGILFILFMLAILQGRFVLSWTYQRCFYAFIASLVPFGTFVLDRQLKKEQLELSK